MNDVEQKLKRLAREVAKTPHELQLNDFNEPTELEAAIEAALLQVRNETLEIFNKIAVIKVHHKECSAMSPIPSDMVGTVPCNCDANGWNALVMALRQLKEKVK